MFEEESRSRFAPSGGCSFMQRTLAYTKTTALGRAELDEKGMARGRQTLVQLGNIFGVVL